MPQINGTIMQFFHWYNSPDGTLWNDLTEHITDKIYTNNDGWGNFRCKGGSVSVWLQE